VSDTNVPWSAEAKLGESVERSRVGKSANHIITHLSTTLDQEPSESKSGTLGWTKGDCAFEGKREGGRERENSYNNHATINYTTGIHYNRVAS
jgi:hypothetical protein